MKRLSILLLVASLLAGCSKAEPDHGEPQAARPPEDVVRSLFIAMLSNDEAGVRREVLPNPNAEVLWQGEAPPKEALRQIKTQLNSMTCRDCKVGETIDLPGGRRLEVTEQMVNENSKLLIPSISGEPMPTPLLVIKTKGEWKVDAGPLIDARLAAERLREKETSNKPLGGDDR